ncbi:STAS domain-containing protein [Marinococcus halophilus]|uniref:STAS domain-containing protein n=1 Tax=Marinococcus halophilus TaxID=1371 RepID=UPI0009A8EE82|nr:STAS domain-containing protein [Marinococcus halophilus]
MPDLSPEALPLPYVQIDKHYKIIYMSSSARSRFGHKEYFYEWLDEGSWEKAKRLFQDTPEENGVELIFIDEDRISTVMDVYTEKSNDLHIHVLLVPKDQSYSNVSGKLERLRGRLRETNTELLEEKETMEAVIKENYRLSAPFIEITKDMALVPLHGDINEQKVSLIAEKVVHAWHRGEYEKTIFDFTGVGEVDEEGMKELRRTFEALTLMGTKVIVAGILPRQAKQLQEMHTSLAFEFSRSLEQVLTASLGS